jgi:hypothetical protein
MPAIPALPLQTYRGSCHCGAVQFTIEAPNTIEAEQCNCSICHKGGFLGLILPLSQFQLLQGADALSSYRFNTGVANHTFCRHCGIKAFYTPRSNPDGVNININCLDTQPSNITLAPFDGQNWEQHAHTLAHKSQPR